MNIILSYCKLNRFYRSQMSIHYQKFPSEDVISDNDLDDIDNIYAGCAFE